MAALLASFLFRLGITIAGGYVIAVGWVTMGLSDAWRRGDFDLADAVLVFAVPTITVAAAWASRHILGASPRLDHQ